MTQTAKPPIEIFADKINQAKNFVIANDFQNAKQGLADAKIMMDEILHARAVEDTKLHTDLREAWEALHVAELEAITKSNKK